jgi:hypothetical protein
MKIGLAGAHRTGKTTLAQAVSRTRGIPFAKTDTAALFKQRGLTPCQSLDFKTRLQIQQHILTAAFEIWETQPATFITDRTPLDFMAYTLADIQGATEVNFTSLEKYLEGCFEVTNKIFTMLVVIQPAIPLVYEEGKAALNKAYLEHLNTIIVGLCHDERLTCPAFIMERRTTCLEDRIYALEAFITQNGISSSKSEGGELLGAL